jgi:hypothetical protein
MKTWTAVARYISPSLERTERYFDFEEFVELGQWMKEGPSLTTLISLRIDYRPNG